MCKCECKKNKYFWAQNFFIHVCQYAICLLLCIIHRIIYLFYSTHPGLPSSLFTHSTLLSLREKLYIGRTRKTAEGIQQVLATRIAKCLHVIVTWDMASPTNGYVFDGIFTSCCASTSITSTNSTELLKEEDLRRSIFNALLAVILHVDIYKPWTKTVCSEVALNYWQQHNSIVELTTSYSQLEALSLLAAHMYLTAAEEVARSFYQSDFNQDFITPESYIHCLNMSLKLTQHLRKDENVSS